jgi:hypothetical protein
MLFILGEGESCKGECAHMNLMQGSKEPSYSVQSSPPRKQETDSTGGGGGMGTVNKHTWADRRPAVQQVEPLLQAFEVLSSQACTIVKT